MSGTKLFLFPKLTFVNSDTKANREICYDCFCLNLVLAQHTPLVYRVDLLLISSL